MNIAFFLKYTVLFESLKKTPWALPSYTFANYPSEEVLLVVRSNKAIRLKKSRAKVSLTLLSMIF